MVTEVVRPLLPVLVLAAAFASGQNPPESKVTPPRVKQHRLQPQYSEEAIREHISGMVKLKVWVGTDGNVRDIEVVRSVGYGLDEETVKAVRTWEFEPATDDGEPIIAAVPVECEFHVPSK
jgi:TonB family protein